MPNLLPVVLTTTLWFLYKTTSQGKKEPKLTTLITLSDILYGAPLLFNIYIRDMFYDIDNCDIASYSDDNTTYTNDFSLQEVIQKLKLITNNLREWFENNHMKANIDKCHLLVTRDTNETATGGEFDTKTSRKEKFLVSKYIPNFLLKIIFLPFAKVCKSYKFYGSS